MNIIQLNLTLFKVSYIQIEIVFISSNPGVSIAWIDRNLKFFKISKFQNFQWRPTYNLVSSSSHFPSLGCCVAIDEGNHIESAIVSVVWTQEQQEYTAGGVFRIETADLQRCQTIIIKVFANGRNQGLRSWKYMYRYFWHCWL